MNQSREAHHPARPLHSPEGGQSAAKTAADWPPEGHLTWTGTLGHRSQGYATGARRDSRRDSRRGRGPGAGPGEAVARWRGRAAELASEAAPAEGASPSLPPTVAGWRGAGQAVKHEWLDRMDLRGGGVPDIRA
jgi:hypothetical protein